MDSKKNASDDENQSSSICFALSVCTALVVVVSISLVHSNWKEISRITMAHRFVPIVSKNLSARAAFVSRPQSIRSFSALQFTGLKKEHDSDGERRPFHTTKPRLAEAATPAMEAAPPTVFQRFVVTAEVAVSKIFPAGFGWQTSSIVAENTFGFAPDTMNFALTTGVGDALGVLGGHCLYYGLKKIVVDKSISMKAEFQTGFLLGSAAFCSGTAWQPLVDALQGANLSFTGVFTGTWIGCGMAFYGGLRAGRTILSGYMAHVEEPTYENSMNDASLSVVIGGATGFFVGTDAAYLPDQNFLIDVVGIPDGTPDLVGCGIAGSSTALGFVTSQSVFNVIYPSGKCWND